MPTYRVQKKAHASNQRKRSGAPQKYSESWRKKLCVLRMCGVAIKDIVTMLPTHVNNKPKRSAQVIIRDLLGDKTRFRPLDKVTARKFAAFLNATFSRPKQAGSGVIAEFVVSPRSITKTLSSDECDVNLGQEQTQPQGPKSSFATTTEDINNYNSTVMRQEKECSHQTNNWRASICSSVDDLQSLLTKFSLGTFSSSSRYSVSVASAMDATNDSLELTATELHDQHIRSIELANTLLRQECCSKNTNCKHQIIEDLIEQSKYSQDCLMEVKGTKRLVLFSPTGRTISSGYGISVNQFILGPDLYNNKDLFYVARVGMPAPILMSIIRNKVNNINLLNTDGQTFLFFLNTRLFRSYCSCQYSVHSSEFECLFALLQDFRFHIDRLDDHGRHFLFYLCASLDFRTKWLSELIPHDVLWDNRVWYTAQLRDSTGLFLKDFMALRPDTTTISEIVKGKICPKYRTHLSCALVDEDEFGTTFLHRKIRDQFVHTANMNISVLLGLTITDINRYSIKGHTPLMDALTRMFDLGLAENWICAKALELIRLGANVNARSRGGSTVLHLAAAKAYPMLVNTLLGVLGIQVDARDRNGRRAVDLARDVFHRSRKPQLPAVITARALKSVGNLIGFTVDSSTSTGLTSDDQRRVDQALGEFHIYYSSSGLTYY